MKWYQLMVYLSSLNTWCYLWHWDSFSYVTVPFTTYPYYMLWHCPCPTVDVSTHSYFLSCVQACMQSSLAVILWGKMQWSNLLGSCYLCLAPTTPCPEGASCIKAHLLQLAGLQGNKLQQPHVARSHTDSYIKGFCSGRVRWETIILFSHLHSWRENLRPFLGMRSRIWYYKHAWC